MTIQPFGDTPILGTHQWGILIDNWEKPVARGKYRIASEDCPATFLQTQLRNAWGIIDLFRRPSLICEWLLWLWLFYFNSNPR